MLKARHSKWQLAARDSRLTRHALLQGMTECAFLRISARDRRGATTTSRLGPSGSGPHTQTKPAQLHSAVAPSCAKPQPPCRELYLCRVRILAVPSFSPASPQFPSRTHRGAVCAQHGYKVRGTARDAFQCSNPNVLSISAWGAGGEAEGWGDAMAKTCAIRS